MSDPFADIRPYRDHEVAAVLQRLLRQTELLDAIAALKLGTLARLFPALCRLLVRFILSRQLRGVTNVHGMQMVVKRYMDGMIEATTQGFSVSGLERLSPDNAYLFISNHRDITLDSAFTNYALDRDDRDTLRIAIGDNLLTKDWVSDLMRLNKSFIVKRALSRPRELLVAVKNLSAYIKFSLLEERASIWLAQREGRAKDGVDRTEPAIIKMLSMSRDKTKQSFAEHIASLNIVPVAISYELDPCDARKARELHQLATSGSYEKEEQEDVASIAQGVTGNKGRVHVSFGTPLGAGFETAEGVASEIDRQIIGDYRLHPTNIFAYRKLNGDKAPAMSGLDEENSTYSDTQFDARIAEMPAEHRPFALAIYANAVESKLRRAVLPDV